MMILRTPLYLVAICCDIWGALFALFVYNCIAYRGLQNFKKLEALIKVLRGMYVLCCAVFRMCAKPKHLTMHFSF